MTKEEREAKIAEIQAKITLVKPHATEGHMPYVIELLEEIVAVLRADRQ